MRFEQCAYCQQPVEVTHLPGGWMRIECESCGAQCEVHAEMLRRIADGERFDAVHKLAPDEFAGGIAEAD